MARTRDRTEDFMEAVCSIASKQGFNEVKVAEVKESLILRRSQQKSPFTQAALKTVVVLVEECRVQIETLRNSIESKERKGLLNIYYKKGDVVNADVIAHKHGVVLILSEHLHSVTVLLDQLRAARYRKVIDRKMPRQLRRPQSKLNSSKAPIRNGPNDIEVIQQNAQAGPKGVQKQILDEETRALQVELTNHLGTAEETEIQILAISALTNLFSTQVLQQTRQIEHLYEQAVEATKNFEKGNKDLSKAIERRSRTFVLPLLFVVVLILTTLFLDWFQ